MTARLHLLLAAACSLALLQLALGAKRPQCTTVRWGEKGWGLHESVSNQQILAGQSQYEFKLKQHLGCSIVKVKITACDYDLPPLIYFIDAPLNFIVYRRGDLRQPANAIIRLYCRPVTPSANNRPRPNRPHAQPIPWRPNQIGIGAPQQ